jgi:hypothetical protein
MLPFHPSRNSSVHFMLQPHFVQIHFSIILSKFPGRILYVNICEALKVKAKLSLWQALQAHRVVRGRGSNVLQTVGSQIAVRLSALHTGRSVSPGRFLVLISIRGWIDLRAIVQLRGLGQSKHPGTLFGIEPATFRFVVECLQLRYGVPHM